MSSENDEFWRKKFWADFEKLFKWVDYTFKVVSWHLIVAASAYTAERFQFRDLRLVNILLSLIVGIPFGALIIAATFGVVSRLIADRAHKA